MTHLAFIYLGYDFYNGSVIAILKISELYYVHGKCVDLQSFLNNEDIKRAQM